MIGPETPEPELPGRLVDPQRGPGRRCRLRSRPPSEFDELVIEALDDLPEQFRDSCSLVSPGGRLEPRSRAPRSGHYIGGTIARDILAGSSSTGIRSSATSATIRRFAAQVQRTAAPSWIASRADSDERHRGPGPASRPHGLAPLSADRDQHPRPRRRSTVRLCHQYLALGPADRDRHLVALVAVEAGDRVLVGRCAVPVQVSSATRPLRQPVERRAQDRLQRRVERPVNQRERAAARSLR